MNILFLDRNPHRCAIYHSDRDVITQVREYAQLMGSAHRLLDKQFLSDVKQQKLPKVIQPFHPCAVWVRESDGNYTWMYNLWYNLCNEYAFRFGGKTHACYDRLRGCLRTPPLKSPGGFMSPPPITPLPVHIKEQYNPNHEADVVLAYREYYMTEKRDFAGWRGRNEPEWWK